MLHKVYRVYCNIKSLDKFGITKKFTLKKPKDMPTTKSTLENTM